MKCITIQSRKVLDEVLQYGDYKNRENRGANEELKNGYEMMKRGYRYEGYPIFMGIVGKKVEFYGVDFEKDLVAIEMDIPKNEIKMQDYYNWTDYIYYSRYQKEFDEVFVGFKDVDDYGKAMLEQGVDKERLGKIDVYQGTVEVLKKEWITAIGFNLTKLNREHNGSGGNNKLKELKDYCEVMSIEEYEEAHPIIITKDLVMKGLEQDIIHIIQNENDGEIAAQIGDYWFYFTNEDNDLSVEEYLKNHHTNEISDLLCDAMNSLGAGPYSEATELLYYKTYLEENIRDKNMSLDKKIQFASNSKNETIKENIKSDLFQER